MLVSFFFCWENRKYKTKQRLQPDPNQYKFKARKAYLED